MVFSFAIVSDCSPSVARAMGHGHGHTHATLCQRFKDSFDAWGDWMNGAAAPSLRAWLANGVNISLLAASLARVVEEGACATLAECIIAALEGLLGTDAQRIGSAEWAECLARRFVHDDHISFERAIVLYDGAVAAENAESDDGDGEDAATSGKRILGVTENMNMSGDFTLRSPAPDRSCALNPITCASTRCCIKANFVNGTRGRSRTSGAYGRRFNGNATS